MARPFRYAGICAFPVITSLAARLVSPTHANESQQESSTEHLFPNWADRLSDESVFVGKGGFGQVFTTQVTCGAVPHPVAIKRMLLESTAMLESAHAEAAFIQELSHPNIIKGYTYEDDGEELPVQMLAMMEQATGGDMYSVLTDKKRPLEEFHIARFTYEMSSALAYMHDKGIVHGDMKLDNVLLDQPCAEGGSGCTVKIADFGLACVTEGASTKLKSAVACDRPAGTLTYASPEFATGLLRERRTGTPYIREQPNDMWALGIILYIALFRDTPRHLRVEKNDNKLVMTVLLNLYRANIPGYDRALEMGSVNGTTVRDKAHELLALLLEPLPKNRATASKAMQMSKEWMDELLWKCHHYKESQDNDWCQSVGEQRGVVYKLFGERSPCEGCWCCKRRTLSFRSQYQEFPLKELPACWESCKQYQCQLRNKKCVKTYRDRLECANRLSMHRKKSYSNLGDLDEVPKLQPARLSDLRRYSEDLE